MGKAKQDFKMKTERLETEKQLLIDENYGLRLQILDLKSLLQVKSNGKKLGQSFLKAQGGVERRKGQCV